MSCFICRECEKQYDRICRIEIEDKGRKISPLCCVVSDVLSPKMQPCDPPGSEENKKLEYGNTVLREENRRLEAEIERLQAEIDETDKMAGAELARRGDEIVELKAEVERLKGLIDILRNEKQALSIAITRANQENEDLVRACDRLNKEHKSEKERLQTEIKNYDSCLDESHESYQRISARNNTLLSAMDLMAKALREGNNVG